MEDIGDLPLIALNYNFLVKLMVNQWWKSHFGIIPQEAYRVPYADIAIEMVESGLRAMFVFGSRWEVNEEKLQKMPVYDRKGEAVSRNVWMMLSDPCFRNQDIVDFISFVEEYYQVNQQGFSREHAAINPMYLGVRAVIAKSIARIHKGNLINHGIIPMIFEHPEDYDWLEQGDELELSGNEFRSNFLRRTASVSEETIRSPKYRKKIRQNINFSDKKPL